MASDERKWVLHSVDAADRGFSLVEGPTIRLDEPPVTVVPASVAQQAAAEERARIVRELRQRGRVLYAGTSAEHDNHWVNLADLIECDFAQLGPATGEEPKKPEDKTLGGMLYEDDMKTPTGHRLRGESEAAVLARLEARDRGPATGDDEKN